jgi:hypothetical protein
LAIPTRELDLLPQPGDGSGNSLGIDDFAAVHRPGREGYLTIGAQGRLAFADLDGSSSHGARPQVEAYVHDNHSTLGEFSGVPRLAVRCSSSA